MVPSGNTVAEDEFHAGVPAGVTVHTARMRIAGTSIEEVYELIERALPQAVSDIAAVRPDVVVLACTAVGGVLGLSREHELAAEIAKQTSAAVVSMNAAAHERLRRARASSVLVLTPYPPDLTAQMAKALEDAGFGVAGHAGMGNRRAFDIAAIDADEVLAFARRQARLHPDADAIFFSCANLRTRDLRQKLAEELGLTVVSSNHAALEQATELLAAATPSR
jgi:maleate isomerase